MFNRMIMIIIMVVAIIINLFAPPMSGLTRTTSSHSGKQLFSLQKVSVSEALNRTIQYAWLPDTL